MKRFHSVNIGLILVLVAVALLAMFPLGGRSLVSADGAVLASSTFDTGNEGWKKVSLKDYGPFDAIVTDGGPANYEASGGNPGGHIATTDLDGQTDFFEAPAKFLGDKSGAYGGTLSFDIKLSGSPNWRTADVVLVGGGSVLVYDTPDSGTTWTHFAVSLSETAGWKKGNLSGAAPSQAEFRAVLARLTALRIRGEYIYGSEYNRLDNVIITGTGAVATPMPTPIPGVFHDSFEGTNLGVASEGITYVGGYSGLGVELDTLSDYIQYPSSRLNEPQGTIEFYWKPPSNIYNLPPWIDGFGVSRANKWWMIDTVNELTAPKGSFQMGIDTPTTVRWSIYDSGWHHIYWDTPAGWVWDTARWYHFAVTYGPRGMELWVDGVLRGSNSYTGGVNTADTFSVGCNRPYWAQSHSMPGTYDELKGHNVQLTFVGVPTPTPTATPTATPAPVATPTQAPPPPPPPVGGTQVSYKAGYNIVAGPGGTTFTQANRILYTSQGGGGYDVLINTQGVTEGWGYWANFPNDTTVTISGTGSTSYTTTLGAGELKMVGNPSGVKSATVAADKIYTYDPATGYSMYFGSATLPVGTGAWVYSAQGGTVTVTAQ